MTIELFEIHPDLSIKEVKKLSRRYAMTGGYELTLKADLGIEELIRLVDLHSPELELYQKVNSECRASNAYRILELVLNHQSADKPLKQRVQDLLLKE